jgi:chemotaxis protein MotA
VDVATLIGLALGFAAIFGGMVLEGGNPMSLINLPAIVIVIGGTIATGFINFPLARITGLMKVLTKAFFAPKHDPRHTVELIVSMAEQSRREGLLSLESKVNEIEDEFIRKGMMLMIDGTDPERLQSIMETELAAREERHEGGIAVLEALGGFAPTIGIIGCVLGLITVLSNLDKPDELGHKIAVAFIATFYGVFIANLIFLPLGGKLKVNMKEEQHLGHMALEGILAIQAGDNPRIVREKLNSFLAPKLRNAGGDGQGAGGAAERAAA